MNPVPMVDLKAQYRRISAEIDAAVSTVVRETRFVNGPECRLFEEEFARYCGVSHACGVANGTDALSLALKALGVGPGDEVVTVAFTFIAVVEAIVLNGARPVFVDVDERTFTMAPQALEAALTERTRAIVPVHLYGHPADIGAIEEVARRHGIPVLEDAAQAHGAELEGRRAGGLARAACFSFYPGKNLGAYGDGGMVVSNDPAVVEHVRQLGDHGSGAASKYEHVRLGTNSRLDTLQAAILRVKLRHLDDWNEERRRRVEAYSRALSGLPGLVLPSEAPGARSAWHLYTVRTTTREALRSHLASLGIATAVHYPKPLHLQPALAGAQAPSLPVSERLAGEVLSLPLYPELPLETVEDIASEIRSFQAEKVC